MLSWLHERLTPQMRFLRRLRPSHQRCQRRPLATPATSACRHVLDDDPLPLPDAAQDERPLGCGWFDSSHELERGLLVQEADDAALCTLPLNVWLDLQQRGVLLA